MSASPVGKAWLEKATKFVAGLPKERRDQLMVLEPYLPSPQKDAWFWYFANHVGWIPKSFEMMMDGRVKAFTVPTEWPEQFDLSYAPPSNVPAAPVPNAPGDRERMTADQLKARLRLIWSRDRGEAAE